MYTVYKHINKNGNIIYIGKSKNLKQRQRQHKKTTEWFNDIDEIEYMEFETKTGMDIAELYLINKYSPTNNKKDNRGENVDYMTIDENWKKFDISSLLINRNKKLGNTSLDNCYKKLNQLIHIDRVGMSATMIDLMDKLLHVAQLYIKEGKENGLSIFELKNHKYSIEMSDILKYRNWKRCNCNHVKNNILKLNNLSIKCLDKKYNFGEMIIFTEIEDDIYKDSINFKINNEILKSFYNLNSAIGFDNKPYYTNMQEKFDIDVNFKQDSSYHIFEYYLRYEGMSNMNKNKLFKLRFDLNEFKSIIGVEGCSYNNTCDFKIKIIDKIEYNLNNIYKCKVKINIGGNRNNKYVDVYFYSRLSL